MHAPPRPRRLRLAATLAAVAVGAWIVAGPAAGAASASRSAAGDEAGIGTGVDQPSEVPSLAATTEAEVPPSLVVLADGAVSEDGTTRLEARADAAVDALGGQVVDRLAGSDTLVVDIDPSAAASLEARPEVVAVIPSEELSPTEMAPTGLDVGAELQSAPIAGAHAAAGVNANWAGSGGAGRTVAILDTGVLTSHIALAGRVSARGCFSTTTGIYQSSCPPPGAPAGSIGEKCTFAGVSDCNHGTAVAGTAVGSVVEVGGVTVGGASPAADYAAVQVFSLNTSTQRMVAFSHDILAALDWLHQNRAQINLASVNMSLGGAPNSPACAADLGGPIVRALRDAGVAVVAAAGNSSNAQYVSWPACIDGVTAVAATTWSASGTSGAWGSPRVATFSNGGPLVDIAAPGSSVMVPGSAVNTYTSMSGTSFASPFVAGAVATWRDSHPGSLAGLVGGLTSSTVLDTRNSLAYPLLDTAKVASAGGAPSPSPAPQPAVTTPPATPPAAPANRPAWGRIDEAAAWGRSIVVRGTATDPDGGTPRVRITVDGVPVATPTPSGGRWSSWIAAGPGNHNVCAEFMDPTGGGWHSTTCRSVLVK